MRFRVIIVLLLSVGPSIAVAEEFVSFESGICKFNLQGCKLTPPVERAIVFGVSRIVDTYRQTFGFSYPDGFKVKVTIFSDKDKFTQYQNAQIGSIISNSGYYSPCHREIVVFWKTPSIKTIDSKKMVGIVFHETNHLVLMHHVPWVPSWLNEGLSEYFEGLNVFGENRRVYLQQNHIKRCKRWLKEGFPMQLDQYISLSYDEWMAFRNKDIKAAYTIGYSLVYYMMSRSKTEKILKELLWEFRRQGKEANSLKAIDDHYPGFKRFEKHWRNWIPRARKYRPLRSLRKYTQNQPVLSTK